MKRLPHVDRAVCEREEDDGFFKIMFTKDYKVRAFPLANAQNRQRAEGGGVWERRGGCVCGLRRVWMGAREESPFAS